MKVCPNCKENFSYMDLMVALWAICWLWVYSDVKIVILNTRLQSF